MQCIKLKDVYGNPVVIQIDDFVKQLVDAEFQLFGLSLSTICDLKKAYNDMNGPLPMTKESIRKTLVR